MEPVSGTEALMDYPQSNQGHKESERPRRMVTVTPPTKPNHWQRVHAQAAGLESPVTILTPKQWEIEETITGRTPTGSR
jgi:hypothetical protein